MNWRSQNTVWLQVHKWTSKSRRKELFTWYCVCAVKPSTTPMTTWQPRSRPTFTQSTWNSTFDMSMCSVPFVCLVLFCLRQQIHELHTTSRGSSFTCARHPMVITSWASLFDLQSSIPFYFLIFSFILNLLHFFLHFFHYLEGRSNPAYFAWKEMDSLDDSYLLTKTGGVPPEAASHIPTSFTVYEPNACDLKETYVESYTESLTHPQFSEQGFFEDVEYDDTALEDMLHEAHRVHVYHSQREGLSVGQSSSSVSERTGRSVGERTGRPVRPSGQELNVAIAQIRTLLDRQRQKRCTKIRWNYWIPARRTSLRSSWRTTSSWTVIAAKFGITWSPFIKVSMKWKN